jgi:cytochrome c oxidase subunit 2
MQDGIPRLARRVVPGAFLLLAGCADYPQTMIEPVTEFGRIQIALWATVTWWTVGIMVVVFGALAFILVRYRERPDGARPKPIYGSTKLEIAWTVIPALIILAIAIPTIRAIFDTQADPPEDALVVEAIGHQWWWEFRYPELDLVTANEFYVPVGRPLALELRSADVIHSFWIPRLGGKKDVNPVPRTPEGVEPLHQNVISLTVDSAGNYLGQCAEFCGTSHAIMRMMAVAVEPEAFDAWVRDMKSAVEPSGEAAARGKEIFLRSTCIACHTIEGTTAQGKLGPDLTMFGERWSIAAGLMENTEENLTEWILHAPELKRGVIMPGANVGAGGMAPTGLSRADAEAIAAYLSDLRRPMAGRRIDLPTGAGAPAAGADTAGGMLVAPAEPLPQITDTTAGQPR